MKTPPTGKFYQIRMILDSTCYNSKFEIGFEFVLVVQDFS